MALSACEQNALDEIADNVSADDPEYSRRLSTFGGYDVSPLGPPSKWTVLPVAIVAVILAIGALVAVASGDHDSTPSNKSQSAVVKH